jgi:hypothetical protein
MRGAGVPTRTITGTALLLALGVVLPVVFHAIPLGGRVFLPMHIPVFIAGLVMGPIPGLLVGAGSPVVSALVTGRPPVFYMVPMVFELATYGVVAGLLRPRIASLLTRGAGVASPAPLRPSVGIAASRSAAVVMALAGAMVAGRAVWLAVVVWLAPLLGISARTGAAAAAAIGAGWIGMAIHLALIPAIVRAIERPRDP